MPKDTPATARQREQAIQKAQQSGAIEIVSDKASDYEDPEGRWTAEGLTSKQMSIPSFPIGVSNGGVSLFPGSVLLFP